MKTFVYSIESERLFRYERRVIHEFDFVSLVSDTDRSFLIGEASVVGGVCLHVQMVSIYPVFHIPSTKVEVG